MKIQNYCYTRGLYPDYRDFAIPSNICGKDVDNVSEMVRPIISSPLDNPVWVLYKTANVIVWGICCQNKYLSDLYKDEVGRPVKGFFAISISDFADKELLLPFDALYFKEIYKNEVEPYWECYEGKQHQSCSNKIVDGKYHSIRISKGKDFLQLNTNPFFTKRLGTSDIEQVISAALSEEMISLAVNYDATVFANSSNIKFPLMNCIVMGAEECSVPLKRACPSCGRLVSHYTDRGICDECAKKAEQDSNPFETDKNNNMENKEQELTVLKRQVRDCRLDIEEKDKKIKKQNRQKKILWIICGVLLLLSLWLFKNSNIKIKTDFASRQSIYQEMAADKHQEPDFFLDVDSQKVEVMAEGQDSVVVGWRTNYSNVEVKMPDVDWAEITQRTKNGLILSIKANESPYIRVAQIKIKPTDGKFKTIEIYQKSAE